MITEEEMKKKIMDSLERIDYTIEDYKKFICDMVNYLNDPHFVKTIYSVIAREVKRTGA